MDRAVEVAYESDEHESKRKVREDEDGDNITFEGERDDDHSEKRRRLMIMRELTHDRKWRHRDARLALRALANCKSEIPFRSRAEPWQKGEAKAMHELESNDIVRQLHILSVLFYR